jgi:hypothetical protein
MHAQSKDASGTLLPSWLEFSQHRRLSTAILTF